MTVSVTMHPAAFTHLNGDTDPFNLEAKYVRVTWFESIASGTAGTLTLPSGATIVLDAFAGGVDGLCSTIAGGMPTYETPLTSGGAVVAATLDAVGNWTLSGAPSAYPVALIYQYRTTLADLDDTKMLGATMADTAQDLSTGAIPTFGGVKLNGVETFWEIGTPGNPATGYLSFYAKSDGKLYRLNSIGVESEVGPDETDPVYSASEAASFVAGDKAKLDTLGLGGNDLAVQFNNAGVQDGVDAFQYDVTSSAVKIGEAVVLLPDNPLGIQRDVDSYLQVNLRNVSDHADASADFIITADDGDDSSYYGDTGLCNSGYASDVWDAVVPHDYYFWVDGGNISIGSLTPTKKIQFSIAQTAHELHPADLVAEVDGSGINLPTGKTYRINGVDILSSGMSNPMTASGDMIYGGTGGAASALAKGTDGKILKLVSGLPSWETEAAFSDEAAQDAVGAMADAESLVYTDSTPLLAVKTQMSITKDASGIKLSGDSASPGNNQVYGTTGAGVKGWKADPTTSLTPATSVVSETSYSLSPIVGTSTNYAREDHSHGSPSAGGGGITEAQAYAIACSVSMGGF